MRSPMPFSPPTRAGVPLAATSPVPRLTHTNPTVSRIRFYTQELCLFRRDLIGTLFPLALHRPPARETVLAAVGTALASKPLTHARGGGGGGGDGGGGMDEEEEEAEGGAGSGAGGMDVEGEEDAAGDTSAVAAERKEGAAAAAAEAEAESRDLTLAEHVRRWPAHAPPPSHPHTHTHCTRTNPRLP